MKRRVLGALLLTLLIAAMSILPSASAQVPPAEDGILAILAPPEVTFGSEAPAWEIPLPILESYKEPKQFKVELAEVKLGKEVVPVSARAVTSGTVSDLPIVLVGGGVTPGELKSYVGLNQKLKAGTELTSQEREQYRLMQEKLESASILSPSTATIAPSGSGAPHFSSAPHSPRSGIPPSLFQGEPIIIG